MKNKLPQTSLVPGDVLLYRERSWTSRAIRLFDGTSVSHAALYLERGTVAEATGDGVVRQPLATSVTTAEQVLVRRMDPTPKTMKPVQSRARVIVAEGHRYAYEQIVLLAFLCLTRRLVPTASLGRFVRAVLDAAAARVAGWFAGDVEPMICSEFVYRAYDEADPDPRDVFTLDIARLAREARLDGSELPEEAGHGRGIHRDSLLGRLAGAPVWRAPGRRPARTSELRAVRPASDAELEQLFEAHEKERREDGSSPGALRMGSDVQAAIERFAAAWSSSRARESAPQRKPIEDLYAVAADFVTPGDLLRTRSLNTVGPLELPATSRTTRVPASAKRRRGPDDRIWTLSQIESESIDIVAQLTPGADRSTISRTTRFGRDLGWDEWYVLRLRAPVRKRFHVSLTAARVKDFEQVGNLVDAVWAELEETG